MLMEDLAPPTEIFIQTSLESTLDWEKRGSTQSQEVKSICF